MFPNVTDKWKLKELFIASDYISYAKSIGRGPESLPDIVVFCYQKKLLHIIEEKFETEKRKDHLIVKFENFHLAVIGSFGIGAPAAVVKLEEAIARGGKVFFSIGSCGALQKDMDIGDIVLCEKAIRDEGTSHHYLPPEKYAKSDEDILMALENGLKKLKFAFHKGSSWTTDAVYRETIDEIKQYQSEGVKCVEMEASALFSVPKVRGVKLGSLFIVSDSLADLKWSPHFTNSKVNLELLFKVIVRACQQLN